MIVARCAVSGCFVSTFMPQAVSDAWSQQLLNPDAIVWHSILGTHCYWAHTVAGAVLSLYSSQQC